MLFAGLVKMNPKEVTLKKDEDPPCMWYAPSFAKLSLENPVTKGRTGVCIVPDTRKMPAWAKHRND